MNPIISYNYLMIPDQWKSSAHMYAKYPVPSSIRGSMIQTSFVVRVIRAEIKPTIIPIIRPPKAMVKKDKKAKTYWSAVMAIASGLWLSICTKALYYPFINYVKPWWELHSTGPTKCIILIDEANPNWQAFHQRIIKKRLQCTAMPATLQWCRHGRKSQKVVSNPFDFNRVRAPI